MTCEGAETPMVRARRLVVAAVVVSALANIAFFYCLYAKADHNWLRALTALSFLCLGPHIGARQWKSAQATLLLAAMQFWYCLDIRPPWWPFPLLPPLVLYYALALGLPGFRRGLARPTLGRLDRRSALVCLGVLLVTVAGLAIWYTLADPSYNRLRAALPRNVLLLWGAGLGFALVTAFTEELMYRGVLMAGLDAALGPGARALVLQGAVFGGAHFIGVPTGPVGALLAGAYGVMQGHVRRMTGGLLAPFLLHVAADLTIFFLIVYWT